MRTLLFWFKDHFSKPQHWGIWIYTFLFLSAAIFMNYYFQLNDKMVAKYFGKAQMVLYYLSMNVIAYFIIAIPLLIVSGKKEKLQKAKFWISVLLFLSLISLNQGASLYSFISSAYEYYYRGYYLFKILSNLESVILYIPFLLLFKQVFDRDAKGLYGLKLKPFNYRPFILLLLAVLPLVLWASPREDFSSTYPTLRLWLLPEVFGMKPATATAIYEIAYGIDFVMVELIFRGALVIGLASIIGKDAILPMAAVYVFIHFGKPLPETISSFFGGYILGVIALYSRSIMGGVVLHIGLAWMMDAAGIIRYYVLN